MNRDKERLKQRAKYIQDAVNKKPSNVPTEHIVKKITNRLFVSRATVWGDLGKDLNKM